MYKKSIRNCMEGELAAISRTSPATFEPASLKRPKLSPEEADYANQEWEVRKVISKEYVASVLHYLVKWCPTLEPQHSLGHVKELMDEFEAQLRAHRGAKNGREGLRLKIKRQVTAEADASRGQQKRSDEDGHGSQSEIGNGSKEVQHAAAAPIQDICQTAFRAEMVHLTRKASRGFVYHMSQYLRKLRYIEIFCSTGTAIVVRPHLLSIITFSRT